MIQKVKTFKGHSYIKCFCIYRHKCSKGGGMVLDLWTHLCYEHRSAVLRREWECEEAGKGRPVLQGVGPDARVSRDLDSRHLVVGQVSFCNGPPQHGSHGPAGSGRPDFLGREIHRGCQCTPAREEAVTRVNERWINNWIWPNIAL